MRHDDRGGWTVDGRRAEWVMLDGSAVDAANPADDRTLHATVHERPFVVTAARRPAT